MERPLVLHIAEPAMGGVGRQLELALRSLPAVGFTPGLLVSLGRPGQSGTRLRSLAADTGAPVDVVPMLRRPAPIRDFISYLRLRRILRLRRPVLVHTHASKAGMLGRRAAWNLGIPAVHTPHVFPFQWAPSRLARACLRYLERRAARWCRRLLLLTDEQLELAYAAGLRPLEKLTVVPNGIDCNHFSPPTAEERRAARKAYAIPSSCQVVGMAARMEPQKAVGLFLRAAASLRQRREATVFLLAGGGRLLKPARDLARELGLKETARFLGEVSDMRRFYHCLDLCVLSSAWEGCPYAVLEAQACGVPVVATDTSGSRALVENGETGLLLPVGDSLLLARAMDRVLADPDLAHHLAAWGRIRVQERHSLERWGEQLAQIYREVLDGGDGDNTANTF